MRLLAAFIVGGVLVACSTHAAPGTRAPRALLPLETPVWVDARFPETHKAAVERALERWNAALGGAAEFTLASDDIERPRDWLALAAHPFGWGSTFTYNELSPEGTPPEFLAQVFPGGDVQFYADHFAPETSYEDIALHEIGHVLGLLDNPPGSSLMVSQSGPHQDCIDAGTIALLSAKHRAWSAYLRAECL